MSYLGIDLNERKEAFTRKDLEDLYLTVKKLRVFASWSSRWRGGGLSSRRCCSPWGSVVKGLRYRKGDRQGPQALKGNWTENKGVSKMAECCGLCDMILPQKSSNIQSAHSITKCWLRWKFGGSTEGGDIHVRVWHGGEPEEHTWTGAQRIEKREKTRQGNTKFRGSFELLLDLQVQAMFIQISKGGEGPPRCLCYIKYS